MALMTKDRLRTLAQEADRLARVSNPGMHLVHDGGLHGLYLQVVGPKSRSWIFRYKRAGKQRDLGLGSAFLIPLQEAAAKADEARLLHAAGGDPVEHRKAEKLARRLADAKGVTFRQAAEEYISAHSPGWKSGKHREQWTSSLKKYVYPVIGSLPIQSVDVGLVLDILRPTWLTTTETTSRVRGRVEAIIDYATPQYRVGDNPARWQILKSKLPRKEKIAKVKHYAALPYADLPTFLAELRGHDGISAKALEFLVLTAARSSEALEATWAEVNFDAAAWTIPGDRTKAGAEHRIPLSERAVEILRYCHDRREGAFVFPGARDGSPVSNAALRKMLATLERPVTVHGFRSTFRDWVAEKTSFARELAEKALAHTVGDETERAYQRGDLFDKRRKLMDAWSRYCQGTAATLTLRAVS